MRTSEFIHDIAEALARAQGMFVNPAKNKNVTVKTRDGRTYNFMYATLDNIITVIRPALAECGLSIVQAIGTDEQGKARLTTRLMHSSGQWIEEVMPIVAEGGGNQALGSAITYTRRYAIGSILNLAPEEDDDGNVSDGNQITDQKETGRQNKEAPAPKTAAPKSAEGKTKTPFIITDPDTGEFIEFERPSQYLDALKNSININRDDAAAVLRWWNKHSEMVAKIQKTYPQAGIACKELYELQAQLTAATGV